MPEENRDLPPQEPAASPQQPADNRIGIEDFAKVQMRVGQVLEAEKVEGSRKLLKLKVDLGSEIRQVVAGIAGSYEPESLIQRKIIVVANLKPAKLMGVISDGMVVAATSGDRAVLATFAEEIPNGSLLR
jgi:methionyl-tRNA synthetase